MMHRAVAGAAAAAALALSLACSSSKSADQSTTPTTPTAPTAPGNVSGTWRGPATDASGPGEMIWVITQNGSAFTGTVTATDTSQAITGHGSLTGTVSNTSIHYSLSFPAGAFDPPDAACTATVSGDGNFSATALNGTYTGTNSCHGLISGGQVTLTKQ